MNSLRDAVPASVRRPVESSRFVQTLNTRAARMVVGPIPDGRMRDVFSRLPHEPEDARMTGVTRSLERRLLALNIAGAKPNAKLPDLMLLKLQRPSD